MKKAIIWISILFFLPSCGGNDTEFKDLRGKEVESTIAATPLSQKELDESLAKIRAEEEADRRSRREGADVEDEVVSANEESGAVADADAYDAQYSADEQSNDAAETVQVADASTTE